MAEGRDLLKPDTEVPPPLTAGMVTPPHLIDVDGELHLDVSAGRAGRKQFARSESAN